MNLLRDENLKALRSTKSATLKRIVFGVSLVASSGVLAAGTATISGETLTVSVDEAGADFTAVTGYAAAKAALDANTVTDFVKTGPGRLYVTDSISAYSGTLHVAMGTYAYLLQGGIGADAVGADVYVADGATLEAAPVDQFPAYFANKTTHFRGTGVVVNGVSHGALLRTGSIDCWRGPFGKNLIMEGDALVKSMTAVPIYFATATLDMNGHDLTIVTYDSSKSAVMTSVNVLNAGNVRSGDAEHAHAVPVLWDQAMTGDTGAGKTWTLGTSDVITLRNDSAANKQVPPKWTLKLAGNAILKNDSGRQTEGWLTDTNRYCWAGPVDLGANTLSLDPSYNTANGIPRQLTVSGVISGSGGLSIKPGSTTSNNRSYANLAAANTFTGGMVIQNAEVYLWKAGAIPNAGEVKATDSSLTFKTGFDGQTLPKTTFSGNSAMSVTDGRGTWTELVKKGSGVLTYGSSFALPKLDVQGGTFKFERQPCEASLTPGWIGGRKTFANDDAAALAVFTSRELLTNLVESTSGPFDDNGYNSKIWTAQYGGQIVANESGSTVVYCGYVNNPGPAADWTFIVGSWGHHRLYVDDDADPVFDTYKAGTYKGTRTISTGIHRIEIRGYRSKNASGRLEPRKVSAFLTWDKFSGWTSSDSKTYVGVRVCRTNATSTDLADYDCLTDPGDGSVVSWNDPALDPYPIHPLTGAQLRVPLVVGDVAVASGAGLDSSSAEPVSVKTLTGGTTVTGAAGLDIQESWTVDGSALGTAAGKLVVTGPLTFAEGAKILLTRKPSLRSGKSVELVSAESIAGEPTVEVPGAEGWQLVRSADGKSLSLYRPPVGLILLFR